MKSSIFSLSLSLRCQNGGAVNGLRRRAWVGLGGIHGGGDIEDKRPLTRSSSAISLRSSSPSENGSLEIKPRPRRTRTPVQGPKLAYWLGRALSFLRRTDRGRYGVILWSHLSAWLSDAVPGSSRYRFLLFPSESLTVINVENCSFA